MSRPPADGEPIRAGVIGLGMIGGGVAVGLARRGRTPAVYDIRPDAARGLPGVPAMSPSPAAVARSSDVVLVAVVDADQTREVLFGRDGVVSAASPGLIAVVLATVAVPVVRELSATCAAAGVALLDCGVTPGNKAAENGMVAIVGGESVAVERARPVLADFAKRVVHCGPSGSGMAAKIARNVITYGTWRTVHEALTLAACAGVDPLTVMSIVDEADPDGATLFMWQRLLAADGPDRHTLVAQVARLQDKDLAAAQELAAEHGVPTPLVDVTREHGAATMAGERRGRVR